MSVLFVLPFQAFCLNLILIQLSFIWYYIIFDNEVFVFEMLSHDWGFSSGSWKCVRNKEQNTIKYWGEKV